MGKIKSEDFQIKAFFEDTMGLIIRRAMYTKGTLTYYMHSKQYGKDIFFEQRPDTSMSCTIEGITRNIPTRIAMGKALGHTPTDMEVCRLVQDVILKMLDEQEDETKRQVGRDFERYSRRGH